jgi:putative tricarboxylic transport membrane protein
VLRLKWRMATSFLRNGDLVSGAVLAGLGVFVVSEARKWEYLTPDGPGPGFFPMWYGLAIVVLALAVVARAVWKRGHDEAQGALDWSRIGRATAAWTALTACIVLLKPLGFLLAFALLTFFVVRVMYGRSLAFAAGSAIAAAAAFYLIFPLALNVMLPVGFLGF